MSQSERKNKVPEFDGQNYSIWKTKGKKKFSNFFIEWCENYKSGDDEEYSEHAHCVSYMARDNEDDLSDSDDEDLSE